MCAAAVRVGGGSVVGGARAEAGEGGPAHPVRRPLRNGPRRARIRHARGTITSHPNPYLRLLKGTGLQKRVYKQRNEYFYRPVTDTMFT